MSNFKASLWAVGWLAFLANPGSALAAKWTVATILVGEYAEMETRLRTTGSSDDVNVVVLHYKSQGNAVAYKLLKDAAASHPPGQCCPNGEATCCDIESIPLSSIGIDGTVSASAVTKFYQYLAKNFPADHYLLGLRGIPGYTRVLAGISLPRVEGITIVELNSAMKTLVDARGGKKVDLLVAGFCTSGNLDWAYGVSPYVDYYVGSPQFTDPPVAMRWRIYRWAREVIENPSISSRDLASKVVDLFALTTSECEDSKGCSNAPKQPWACVAVETAKLPAVAAAVKDVVCAVLPSVTSSMHKSVLAATTLNCSTRTPRYDMASYFMNLKTKVTDAAALAAIDRVIAAHDASIVNFKHEPGYNDGKAFGYSFYATSDQFIGGGQILGDPSEIGNWQIDSLWKAYMAKVGNSASALPAATGMVIDPAAVDLGVGDRASLTARGVSSEYPSMCALPSVTWSAESLNGVAVLDSTSANPAALTGKQPGTGVLKASASGFSAQTRVTVSGSGEVIAEGDEGTPRPDPGTPRPDASTAGSDEGAVRLDAGRDPSSRASGGGIAKPASDVDPFASCGTKSAIGAFLPPLFAAGLRRRRRAAPARRSQP